MGILYDLLSVDETKLQNLYHRAWLEANRGFVDPRIYRYLDDAIFLYAKEHDCSYDDAFVLAKTGKKTGRLKDNE